MEKQRDPGKKGREEQKSKIWRSLPRRIFLSHPERGGKSPFKLRGLFFREKSAKIREISWDSAELRGFGVGFSSIK